MEDLARKREEKAKREEEKKKEGQARQAKAEAKTKQRGVTDEGDQDSWIKPWEKGKQNSGSRRGQQEMPLPAYPGDCWKPPPAPGGTLGSHTKE
jgi:hypothetical protein